MTDNELKVEAMRLAMDIARENMFAKRQTLESRWESRTTAEVYPDLPGTNVEEVLLNYTLIAKALGVSK